MPKIKAPSKGPKILTLDIETSPHVASVWGLWDQNVGLNQLRELTQVICWAAKWHGKEPVEFRSDHHDGHAEQTQRMWELMSEADILVGYNHKGFDIKHLNREFLLLGLNPPSPYKTVDLLLEARRNFKFASNKLDHVAVQLGFGQKVQHEGMPLWHACVIDDDPRAWRTMREYNIHDVILTEKVFDRLTPWLKLPNMNHYYPETWKRRCTTCTSENLVLEGFEYTAAGKFQRFSCKDCGKFSKDPKRVSTAELRPA